MQLYKGFVVLISLFPFIIDFENVTEQNNDFYQFDVGHDQFYPCF